MNVQVYEIGNNVRQLDLEEILSKALIRIKVKSEGDLSGAREAIDDNIGCETYFKFDKNPGYYHGKLKRIIGISKESFAVQLIGSDRPNGFLYRKLKDLIIIRS